MTTGTIDVNEVGEGTLTEEQLIYRENILDHYKHPHNKGQIEHADVYHKELNPSCGDIIEVFVKLDERDAVSLATFDGSGCAISQAAMSMLTDKLVGMTHEEVLALSQQDIVVMLNIPIGPVRMKCAMIGLRTTQAALKEISTRR